MADIIRFTDPDDDATIRLDISNDIAGEVAPDFGLPQGDRRTIRFQLDLTAATKPALVTKWQNLVKEIERASALEVRLDGLTDSVWFDPLRTVPERRLAPDADLSRAQILYDWIEGSQQFMKVSLELVCEPYARGAEETPASAVSLASAPNGSNHFEVSAANAKGDVEAPAKVEVVFDTTPNRLLARLYRRTRGSVANFITLLEAETAILTNGTASQVEAAASEGNSTRTTPANQSLNKTHAWAVSANRADKTGVFHLYAKIRDGDTTPGRIKARLDLVFADAAEKVTGEVRTITADADHDGNTSYELHYLGTYQIPAMIAPGAPAAWTWELYLQRTTGVATIDLDYLAVLPADESVAIMDFTADTDITAATVKTFHFDTPRRIAWWGTLTSLRAPAAALGGLWIKPGVINRFIAQISADTHVTIDDPPSIVVDGIASATLKYRPLYAFVR